MRAAALLDSQGDAALDVPRDPSSRFTRKDTYVFVVDCKADRVLSNPRIHDREEERISCANIGESAYAIDAQVGPYDARIGTHRSVGLDTIEGGESARYRPSEYGPGRRRPATGVQTRISRTRT